MTGFVAGAAVLALLACEPMGVAQAQDTAAQQEAPHFMAVTGKQAVLDSLVEGVNLEAMALLAHGGVSSFADRAKLTNDLIMPELRKASAGLMQQWTQIYAADLSVDDMKALETFYATPAGQRILQSDVQISNSVRVATVTWQLTAIRAAIRMHTAELRKYGYEE